MMNGLEKSDPAIVAKKPTNKAEQPAAAATAAELKAAEPVERRAGTKGSADQQSTRRTTGSNGERIGHCRHGASISPSRMAGSARSRLQLLRTRSSNGLWLRC